MAVGRVAGSLLPPELLKGSQEEWLPPDGCRVAGSLFPELPFLGAPRRNGCRPMAVGRVAGSLLPPELPFLGAPWRNGCRLTAVGQQALSSLGSRRARRLPPGRLEAVAPSCTPLPGGTLAGTTLAEGGVPAPPGGPGLSRRLHELLRRNTPLGPLGQKAARDGKRHAFPPGLRLHRARSSRDSSYEKAEAQSGRSRPCNYAALRLYGLD